MRRAVFMDRDGVLNRVVMRAGNPSSPRSLAEFAVVGGAAAVLRTLRRAGYLLIVATNQPEVARRLQEPALVEEMHRRLRAALPLDDIRVCWHDERHRCGCRKPEPGLLLQAAAEWEIELSRSYMIGDRLKDIDAGRRAGCRTILLSRPYNRGDESRADYCAASLRDACAWILERSAPAPEAAMFRRPGGIVA